MVCTTPPLSPFRPPLLTPTAHAHRAWGEIQGGRDYQSRAAWLLLLPPALVEPLLQLQPGAPPLRPAGALGGGSSSKPTVTLTLTLWLAAAPSYEPAFRVVAAPLLPPVSAGCCKPARCVLHTLQPPCILGYSMTSWL